MMNTFDAAEKYFLGGSSGFDAWAKGGGGGGGGGGLNFSYESLTYDGEVRDSVGLSTARSRNQDNARSKIGGTWLRKHVKDRLAKRSGSQENLLTRSLERSGTLAPLFEGRTLAQTHREGVRSHHIYNKNEDRDLFQSLKRFHSSSLIHAGPSVVGLDNLFARPDLGKRMATVGTTKLYRSSPQLNRKAHLTLPSNEGKLPDIKTSSVPNNINSYLGGGSSSRLPSINSNNDMVNSQASINSSTGKGKAKKNGLDADSLASKSGSAYNTAAAIVDIFKEGIKQNREDGEEGEGDREEGEVEEENDERSVSKCSIQVERVEVEENKKYAEAERQAEEEVRHNWLLAEENVSRMKRFESRKNRLLIRVSDSDTVDAIEDRLEELRMMAKPKKDEGSVLDKLTPEQRHKILIMKNTPIAVLNKQRRKGWKPLYKLRWACSMIILLSKTVQDRKQYYVNQQESDRVRRKIDGETEIVEDTTTPDKPSLGLDLLLALTTQPDLRTNKTVKRILWLLRATKAFKNLFPAEMEMELAKVVGYERYDDGRVISRQGRTPERFYYIISGKVGLYRQYKLSTGQVTKGMGFLTKGMTTDPEQLEKGYISEDSLVAKGQVEVLIVDRDSFSFLQHTTVGPPIDFLKSLDLFEEFPVERFANNMDAIEYTYYGAGKLIVPDSNRTPWLHIIKSGQVKVVRTQTVIDARATNESKFDTPRIEALGCGKTFSHANAMLGVQAKQKKQKATATVKLPEIDQDGALVSNPFGTTLGVESTMSPGADLADVPEYTTPPSTAKSKKSKKSKKEDGSSYEDSDERDSDGSDSERSKSAELPEPDNQQTNQYEVSNSAPEQDQVEETDPNSAENIPDAEAVEMSSKEKRRRKDATLPIINIPVRPTTDVYQPHAIWLTREKTEAEAGILPPDRKGLKKKEAVQRPAYLQLGVLTPGDVFGLDHMQPALASEAQGVSLLSDGAEVIKISKRFFLQNAGNNTMLKVETMSNEYISEDEAKQVLFDKETWSQYKAALWEKMTANRPLVTT